MMLVSKIHTHENELKIKSIYDFCINTISLIINDWNIFQEIVRVGGNVGPSATCKRHEEQTDKKHQPNKTLFG